MDLSFVERCGFLPLGLPIADTAASYATKMTDYLNGPKSAPMTETPAWKAIVAKYQKPAIARSAWQLANTLIPWAALWVLSYFALSVSIWLTVPLAILLVAFSAAFYYPSRLRTRIVLQIAASE